MAKPNSVIPIQDLPILPISQQSYIVTADTAKDKAGLVFMPDIQAASSAVGAEIYKLNQVANQAIQNNLAESNAELQRKLDDVNSYVVSSIEEIVSESSQILSSIGYLPPVPYASGLSVTSSRFTVGYEGSVYSANPQAVPFVSDPSFDPAQWRLVQGVMSSDLSSPTGSSLIGYQQPGGVLRNISQKILESISPEDCGAVVGTVSAQQAIANVLAINTCLSRASSERKVAEFSGGTYQVDVSSTPLKFPSNLTVLGNGCRIVKVDSSNKPIAGSSNYFDNTSPAGRLRVYDVTFVGTGTGLFSSSISDEHGFILRDYYSRLRGCRVDNAGGRGIFQAHTSANGSVTTGTLVENRISDCEVNLSGRTCFYNGQSNNNKITDGFLINCVARLAGNATEAAIVVGSSAGWVISGNHTYGGSPTSAVIFANCYNTFIGPLYVEAGWTQYAVDLPSYQKSSRLDSLFVESGSVVTGSTAAAIRISRSSAFSTASFNIGSITISADTGSTMSAIRNENAETVSVSVANSVRVSGAGTVALPATSASWYSSPVESLKQSSNGKSLLFSGYGIPIQSSVQANQSGEKVCQFSIPYLGLGTQCVIDVLISARQNSNGAPRAFFSGKAIVNSKSDSDSWVVRMVDMNPAATSGFSSAPIATISNNPLSASDRSGILTITFTYANSDAYGRCHFSMSQEGI